MDREDYERGKPPRRNATPNVIKHVRGFLAGITCANDGGELAERPDQVCLVLHVPGAPHSVCVPMGKEDTDGLIACLISARNEVWVTP